MTTINKNVTLRLDYMYTSRVLSSALLGTAGCEQQAAWLIGESFSEAVSPVRSESMQPQTDPPTLEIRSTNRKQAGRAQGESNFESLLDVAEAAKLLRIHPKTLRNKARRGIIPGVQVGRLWRFRASALNEWLDEIAS
jgi:excisionase family DNA binding protein